MADRAHLEAVARFFQEQVAFHRFLGLKVEAVEEGYARLRLPYREEFLGDPFRPALHGGVSSFLIDTSGGAAVLSRLPPGGRCSTVDMRVDYLRPAATRDLVAEARVVRLGNRVAVCTAQVYHSDDSEPVADGRAVYNVRRS